MRRGGCIVFELAAIGVDLFMSLTGVYCTRCDRLVCTTRSRLVCTTRSRLMCTTHSRLHVYQA